MAQAEYVINAIRALFTGASAKPSTSPIRARNVPGGLDLRHIGAVLSDLASDVTGSIRHAADGMVGRVA